MPTLNIGYEASFTSDRIFAILPLSSKPMKAIKETAKDGDRFIDATYGKPTRAFLSCRKGLSSEPTGTPMQLCISFALNLTQFQVLPKRVAFKHTCIIHHSIQDMKLVGIRNNSRLFQLHLSCQSKPIGFQGDGKIFLTHQINALSG
jgi:hypothetical protein